MVITTNNTLHAEEWCNKSGVSRELYHANCRSIDDPSESADLIKWKNCNFTGWWVGSIDLFSGKETEYGQFKPDNPLVDEKGKVTKYVSPKGVSPDLLLLDVPQGSWMCVQATQGKTPDTDSYAHFWDWVLKTPDVPIIITEGAKKAAALLTYGYVAVSIQGVANGLTKGGEDLVPALKRFANDRTFYLCFDSDITEKASVRKELKKLGDKLASHGCDVGVMWWDGKHGKGIDDYLVSEGYNGLETVMQSINPLNEYLETLERLVKPSAASTGKGRGKSKAPSHGQVAAEISERYRDRLAWHTGLQLWYQYAKQSDGLWSEVPSESVYALVKAHLMTSDPSLANTGYIKGVMDCLKSDLMVSEWDERVGLIPLRDGVLDITTRELTEHSPGYRFLWQLPYKWGDRTVGCEPVQAWLLEAMNGKANMVQLLRAWLNVVVCRRTNLQRFIECIGAGGTGKGTFFRLAAALVGKENVAITKLKELETNRFETASFVGKALIQVTESEKFVGEVPTLKALTGQDPIRCERKGVQQLKPFVPNCTVMVSANEPIQTADYTSGLQRRRLTTMWTHQVESDQRRDLEKEFEPYLPGLLFWVLEMLESDVVGLVRDTPKTLPEQQDAQMEMLVATNPMAEWVNGCIVYDPELADIPSAAIGIKSGDPEYQLYPSYCKHMEEAGKRPIAIQSFAGNLEDLCRNQLKWKGVRKVVNRSGRFFTGIRFRRESDNSPTSITRCDGLVMDCDGLVMDETLTSAECDGCDGLLLVRDSENVSVSENGLKGETIIKESEKSITSITSITDKDFSHHASITPSSHPSQVITDSLGQVITEGCSVTYVGNVKSYAKTHAGKEYTVVAVKPNTVDVKETRDAFSPHEVLVVRTASN